MTIPAHIDHFNILKELGKGSQGVVYLASDPRLDRQVAIKTLHRHISGMGEEKKRLLREARTVSKLQHPNVIPLYDVGEYQGKPYLVFEYVEGISLQELIKREGQIVVHRAVTFMRQILDGIAYAHQQGVVHRDMSPANILISKDDMPRIMDFGISIMTGSEPPADTDLSGTPCYMSPEHFSKKPIGPQSDIFAAGLIFYEMLVGHPAIEADNHFAVMYKIANEPIPPPSLSNQIVDKQLDMVISKALEKEPESRYPNATIMREELDKYMELKENQVDDSAGKGHSHSTLDFLLRKMRHKGDFPSFSKNIVEINRIASISKANYSSASELANAILKDYSLTNKLLKLVNSAFYGNFAKKVTTVSRAVVVLGFEQVSMVASCLLVFEHLKNKSQSVELQDASASSFMSGMIAKDIAKKFGFQGTEEAFICSMLHNLGEYLVLFYFPEESVQIKNLMARKGINEVSATRSVLGITYEDLGIGVARSWQFPEKILRSMESLPEGKPGVPKSDEDMLRNLAGFSNELCAIVGSETDEKDQAMKKLLKRFDNCFPMTKNQIGGFLETVKNNIAQYSEALNIDFKKSRFMKTVAENAASQEQGAVPLQDQEAAPQLPDESIDQHLDEFTQTIEIPAQILDTDELKDPQSILINGIQEITNTLLENYELNDVLNMILETMYRGFRFNCVLFCLGDKKRSEMTARSGFGKDVENIMKKFRFELGKSTDVFNLALSQAKDLGIDDAFAPGIQKGIPAWYRNLITAPAFVIFPIVINKKAVGLIYADRELKGRVLEGNHLNYMKTLCNQAIMAMKQSQLNRG